MRAGAVMIYSNPESILAATPGERKRELCLNRGPKSPPPLAHPGSRPERERSAVYVQPHPWRPRSSPVIFPRPNQARARFRKRFRGPPMSTRSRPWSRATSPGDIYMPYISSALILISFLARRFRAIRPGSMPSVVKRSLGHPLARLACANLIYSFSLSACLFGATRSV